MPEILRLLYGCGLRLSGGWCVRWLAETGRIFLDPAALWTLRKPERPLMPVPTEKQVAALLAQPDLTRPRGSQTIGRFLTASASCDGFSLS